MTTSLRAGGSRFRCAGHPPPLHSLIALFMAALTACGGGEKTITIKGDVPGLDSIVNRGDSLLAMADRNALMLDSMKASMRAELARAELTRIAGADEGTLTLPRADGPRELPEPRAAIAAPTLSPGDVMSQRAQARGDSMARAVAQQLAGTSSKERARGDSVRGVLALQGEEPAQAVVLRVGNEVIALSGMATSGMARLVGTEVVVRGVKVSLRDIVVADYIVRAADGVPAFDGTLLESGALRLTDGSGSRRVPLPPALRGLHGARVWVAVKDGAPTAYGMIGRR